MNKINNVLDIYKILDIIFKDITLNEEENYPFSHSWICYTF